MQTGTKAVSLREEVFFSAGRKYKDLRSITTTQGLTLIWVLRTF